MQQSKFPDFLIDIIFSHKNKQITLRKIFKKKMVLNNKITSYIVYFLYKFIIIITY